MQHARLAKSRPLLDCCGPRDHASWCVLGSRSRAVRARSSHADKPSGCGSMQETRAWRGRQFFFFSSFFSSLGTFFAGSKVRSQFIRIRSSRTSTPSDAAYATCRCESKVGIDV